MSTEALTPEDSENIQSIMDDVFMRAGYILDEDYDGAPGSTVAFSAKAQALVEAVEEHLSALFSQLRSDAPSRR